MNHTDTLENRDTLTNLDHFLNAPITDERPWVVFAACKDADPELFFPSSKYEEREALALCRICPVQRECLDYAFDAKEVFGIWGGLSEKQRRTAFRRTA